MIPLKDRKVVLVGGAGFIGHHLATELARRGARVSVVDSLGVNNLLSFASADHDPSTRELYLDIIRQRLTLMEASGVPVYTHDARDRESLKRCLDHLRPQVVIHLAGISHAHRSNQEPQRAFEHTLATLENTLECVRGFAEHIVYFSSSMVYGDFPDGLVTEETPCRPLGIYGALKYGGEKLVIAHQQVYKLPYTIIRPSALYGERCVSRRVIQVFAENVLQGQPLIINGDGTEQLDFTYIDDLVHGIVCVLESEDARNETFNLTFGRARMVRELVDLMRSQFDGVRVEVRPRPRLMPHRGTLCIDKARSLIGYTPQHPVEAGVPRYLDWYRSLERFRGRLMNRPIEVIAAAS